MSHTTAPVGVIPPPLGVTPNFDHPEDDGWRSHLVGLVICDVLVTLFFALRCYVKYTVGPKILPEDWTCAMAWLSMVIYTGTVFMMIRYGEGFHAWEVTRENYSEILKWLYASSIIYCPAAYFTKVTLLMLMARVFAVKTKVVIGIRCFIVGLTICYLPIQAIKIAICIPIRVYWDTTVQGAQCFNQRKVFISDLSLAIVTDFVVLLVPVPLTWSLNIPLRKKFKIVALLGAGGAATGVTIFRLVKVIEFLGSTDVTHDFALLDLTTTIEVTIGLICACLPAVNLLVEKHTSPRFNPNSPRTISKLKKYYHGGIHEWWCSRHDEQTATRAHSPRSLANDLSENLPLDFDVEQQMLSGRPIAMEQVASRGHDLGHLSKITSVDGRREGWLVPDSATIADNPQSGGIRRTVEISLQLTHSDGDEPVRRPDKIWDGSLNEAVSYHASRAPR